MRAKLMRAAVAALTTTALAATLPSPVHAGARVGSTATVEDKTGDVAVRGEPTSAQKAGYDVLGMTGRAYLGTTGTLYLQTVVRVKNAEAAIGSYSVESTVTVDGDNDYTATAKVAVQGDTTTRTLTVGDETVKCTDLALSRQASKDKFVLTIPVSCLPGTGTTQVNARLVTGKVGGGGRTTDAVAAASGIDLDIAQFRKAPMSEALGDVDYGDRVGQEREVVRSVDMISSTAVYLPTVEKLRVTIKVLDLSTRRYHPDQRFAVGIHDGEEEFLGAVGFAPDRSGGRNHEIVTEFPCATAPRVVIFDDRTDTIAIDVPKSCFGTRRAVHVMTGSGIYDSTATGVNDTTPLSPLLALR